MNIVIARITIKRTEPDRTEENAKNIKQYKSKQ